MCKFLQNILIFLAVIVAMDYGLGSVLGYMNLQAKVGDNGRDRVINQEMTSDIVILGSSRALHHYVPSIIEDSLGVTCHIDSNKGYAPVLKTMDINETVTARKHPEIIFDSLKITYLDSLIKLCLTRGTDFSFYVSPSLEVKSAKVFEPALKLAKKYGIAFGNHSADEPFAHSPNLFSDVVI